MQRPTFAFSLNIAWMTTRERTGTEAKRQGRRGGIWGSRLIREYRKPSVDGIRKVLVGCNQICHGTVNFALYHCRKVRA